MLRVIAIAVLLAALAPGVARGSTSWRWPVRGQVVGSFSTSPDAPYAAGQRRGIAIAARPGTAVASACAGRVAFAGSVGRAGPTISVQCGALRATYQGLSGVEEAEGAIVLPGQIIARMGSTGVLRLGARRSRGRYVDPATLLRAEKPHLGPAPRPRPRPSTRRQPPRPTLPPVAAAPAEQPAPEPHTPPLVWLSLAAFLAAAPLQSSLRRACRSTSRRRSTTSTQRPISGTRTRRSAPTSSPATCASAARTSSS